MARSSDAALPCPVAGTAVLAGDYSHRLEHVGRERGGPLMAGYHVNPVTNRAMRCQTTPDRCPIVRKYPNLPTLHFDDKKAAEKQVDRVEEALNTFLPRKGRTKRISEEERVRILDATFEKFGIPRNRTGLEGTTLVMADENGVPMYNPALAAKRLDAAMRYAAEQRNEHLVNKLAKARLMPSGTIRLKTGEVAKVDALLDEEVRRKNLETQVGAVKTAISHIVKSDSFPADYKKSLTTPDGTRVTMSVKTDQLDTSAWEALPEEVREQCSREERAVDWDAVERVLADSPSRRDMVFTDTLVVDTTIGRIHDVNQGPVRADLQFAKGRKSLADQADAGVAEIGRLYETAHEAYGDPLVNTETGEIVGVRKRTMRDVKKSAEEHKRILRAVAGEVGCERGGYNVAFPGKAHGNMAVIGASRRHCYEKRLREVLTAEEFESVMTAVKRTPDREKCLQVLGKKEADRLFGATTATIRVTEPKSFEDAV